MEGNRQQSPLQTESPPAAYVYSERLLSFARRPEITLMRAFCKLSLATLILLPSLAAAESPPALLVEAVYPGASAAVVAATVAAPIEQQLRNLDKRLRLWSRCAEGGNYSLTITFKHGTDLALAQVLVQNRVNLAMPVLPAIVRRRGVTVREGTAGVLMIVPLVSPDASRDVLYLSNYAVLQLVGELARVRGVGRVSLVGQRDYSLRIWADSDRLAAFNLTLADLLAALKKQKVQVEVEKGGGKGFPLIITTRDRLSVTNADTYTNMIVKQSPGGHVIRLRDVARIEVGAKEEQSRVGLDGKPAVALVVRVTRTARPREVGAALKARLAELREQFPKGLDFGAAFDFTPNLEAPDKPTTPAYLLVNVALPDGASPERVAEAVDHCAATLRKINGVKRVLTLSGENPFDRSRTEPASW